MQLLEMIRQGETLFAEGRLDEATKHFRTVLKSDPSNADAHNNLAVVAMQQNNLETATAHLVDCLRIDPYNRDAVLNCTEVFKLLKQPHLARPVLENFLQNHPDDPEISAAFASLPAEAVDRLKLAVLSPPGMETFLGDITRFLSMNYDLQTCYDGKNDSINQAISWADVIWVEWANELAVALTNGLPLTTDKRVICRLHSYEAFAGYASQIKWERIDDLIFVADHIRDYMLSQVPDLLDRVRRIHVIPNGVDLKSCALKERRPGKKLAFLGYINYKKGPMLLLHAFAELVRQDPEYRLFMGGRYQDDRYRLYFSQMVKQMGLEDNLQFDGWINDVPAWLEDKQYIVCSSVLESQGMGIMEAMACGLKPVVHNFVGARNIYSNEHIWNTIPEFVQMVRSEEFDSAGYRSFVDENYSLELQLTRLNDVMAAGTNDVHAPESWCGAGSYVENTKDVRQFLQRTLDKYGAKSIIDVGCGDMNWMRLTDLSGVDYTGYDLDVGFIEDNRIQFPHLTFEHADVRDYKWPQVDLIFCRDLLIHLNHQDILKLLAAFKESGSRYLITTTYDDVTANVDFTPLQKSSRYSRERRASRKLNLQLDPFLLGKPIEFIRENNTEACQGRIVGIWDLQAYEPPEHPLIENYAGKIYACSSQCNACLDAQYEREDAEFAKQFIKPGGVVLDIGAHAGLYSVLAHRLMNGQGTIHAFEMEDHSWKVLQKTATMYPSLQLHRRAVWSRDTELAIVLSAGPGLHYVRPHDGLDNNSRTRIQHSVKAVSLDSFFSDDFTVDFIKLDIEGAELHALWGMEQILRRSGRVGMVIEFVRSHLERQGQSSKQVVEFLESLGFHCVNLKRDFLIDGLLPDMTVKAHYLKG